MIERFLILLLYFGQLYAAPEWEDPGFKCVKPAEEIQFCDDKGKDLFVNFFEEVPDTLLIAYINCKDCDSETNKPTISDFIEGTAATLGAELKRVNNVWELQITKKQDFEIESQRGYTFSIFIGNEDHRVKLQIKDIDDNPPFITVNQRPCTIEENSGKIVSNCTYTIEDADSVTNMADIKYNIEPADERVFFSIERPSSGKASQKIIVNLQVDSDLDFETNPLHVFTLTATDQGDNNDTASVIIEVKDMPDQPPKWNDIFATKTFPENEPQIFKVLAKDGDIKINELINYKMDSCDAAIEFEVDVENIDGFNYGVINIEPIDRDILKSDLITCSITAFEIVNETSNISTNVTFIILDVNDNAPIISAKTFSFKINENETTTLIEKFSINDIDLGKNAQYDVKLTSKDPNKEFHKAFQVIPNTGYQAWDFEVTVVNSQLLDYEKEEWRSFSLLLKATDRGEPKPFSDEKEISITLNNMNNKIPYFTMKTTVELFEDLKANAKVIQLIAKDDDTGDSVKFSLSVDSLKDIYNIDETTGLITTKSENTFDYEKQTQVYIQVQVTDQLDDGKNPLHHVTTQIIVNVKDVNDESPRITLPTKSPLIEENEPIGTLVTKDIIAVDVDTGAYLDFKIEWDKTVASKPGTEVKQQQFEGVFKIEAKPVNGKTGNVLGELKVANKDLLDYEVYEVIYLYITVTDTNQTINTNTDSAIMTVRLIDVNDCPPIFKQETIEAEKSVDEEALNGTFIAVISATDADGPNNNVITYSLKATRPEDKDLVRIDPKSGTITVSGIIDADYPNPIFDLKYTVFASDKVHNTEANIKILVNDKNNKYPKLKEALEPIIYVDENTKQKPLQQIHGGDDDRDEPHNTVTYYLNVLGNTEQRSLFSVNSDTGEIFVNITDDKYELDRDDGPESYDIFLILRDNPGQTAYNEISNVSFKLILNDLNDNKPILQDTNPMTISEDDKMNTHITNIIAIDKDQLCTPNTEITYKILTITDKDNTTVDNIFRIETKAYEKCKNHGQLFINKLLAQKYYGNFNILIQALDAGDGPQSDTKTYPITIVPFSYKAPVIVYPKENDKIILRTGQKPGQRLQKITSGYLNSFEASDEENKFMMSFKLVDTPNADEATFTIINADNNQADLELKIEPTKSTYNLVIEASHNGPGSAGNKVQHKFMVLFVDLAALPIFPVIEKQIAFKEETEVGCEPFEPAIDTKCDNILETCSFAIFYHIMSGNEEDQFMVDATNADETKLCLKAKLDRETKDYHHLIIVATNEIKAPVTIGNAIPLNLTVEVIDINDNEPVFSSEFYSGSLTVGDVPERIIIGLDATDKDSTDEGKLKYSINYNTVKVSHSSLNNVKNQKPFIIANTKQIISNFKVISDMQGYFTFDVIVEDSPPEKHQDTAEVKIYIIAEANRVVFTFKNDVDKVKSDKTFIEQVFSEVFAFNCTVDDTYKKVDESSGNMLSDQTDVKTHFIDEKNNLPVEKNVITVKSAEFATVSMLRVKFLERGLNFSDVPIDDLEKGKDLEELLKTLLIVVSVVLGTLCIVLLLAFILRTRTLKKRLEAMTINVFGSTKSDLNRIGTSAPGTNKHAIEANPVWNEDLNNVTAFDSISQGSGGSDLIGIEDNPEFDYTNIRRDSVNPVLSDNLRRQSLNPMAAANQNNVGDLNKFNATLDNNNMLF